MEKKLKKQILGIAKFTLGSRLAFILAIEIVISIGLSLLALLLFLQLGNDLLKKEVISFDNSIIYFFYQIRIPQLTSIMLAITSLGSGLFLIIASAVMMFYLYLKRKRDAFIFFIIL